MSESRVEFSAIAALLTQIVRAKVNILLREG